jgi:carbon monoxide dehydrogenase subunit G
MAFEISKTFAVHAPAAKVWEFLLDVERVARCLPGAAVTGKLDEKTWSGTMSVKLGPVSSSYKGKIIFEKIDAAARTAEIAATGADVRGKGGADLRLTSTLKELAPAETEVSTVSRVNISGILAQMGRGMVEDVAERMFQTFAQNMRAELEQVEQPQAVSQPVPPPVQPQPPAPLDVGALGAKVMVRRPEFWLVLAAAAAAVWWLLR